jgi:hypothetical protein
VWRLLLIPAVVAAIGLAAVEAGGFPTSAEDLSVYSTSTSLTEPCTPTPLPAQLWLRGSSGANPGSLDLAVPAVFDAASVRAIDNGFDRIWEADDRPDYQTWSSPSAPICGYLLTGHVTLLVDQDGSRDDRLTAGLFRCPATAGPETTTPTCQLLASDLADTVANGVPRDSGGYLERTVSFDNGLNTLIPEGQQLRVKVVNERYSILIIFGGGSLSDWHLKWGYRSDRQSRLVISP